MWRTGCIFDLGWEQFLSHEMYLSCLWFRMGGIFRTRDILIVFLIYDASYFHDVWHTCRIFYLGWDQNLGNEVYLSWFWFMIGVIFVRYTCRVFDLGRELFLGRMAYFSYFLFRMGANFRKRGILIVFMI